MTAPNFYTLRHQHAIHHTLITHQELPKLLAWDYDAVNDMVILRVETAEAVDDYAEAFRVQGPEPDKRWSMPRPNGTRAYYRHSGRLIISAHGLAGPPPKQATNNAGPERAAAVS